MLIFIILLLIGSIILFKLRRSTISRSQAGYDLLSHFSDTILFQYDCRLQMLTFTANIASRFQCGGQRCFQLDDKDQLLYIIHPDDVESFRKELRTAENMEREQLKNMSVRFIDKDGEYRWMLCQIQTVVLRKRLSPVIIGKLSDIEEQRSKEEQLIEKATIDAMTGVFNRKAAENRVTAKLMKSGEGFLFMIDIDNFKNINDTMGHAAGDNALISFAEEIRKTFRHEDVIGRVGGDEFIVFMADTNKAVIPRHKAEVLLERLSTWEEYDLSASIGIASYPIDGSTYKDLYEAADAAMYQVKQQGKNGYCFSQKSRL